MKKITTLTCVTTLALTGGLFLSSAAAEHRPRSLGHAVEQVERASDALFVDYKNELQHRGLWKPRGGYSTVYSATFRLEEYGDALRKYYDKRASLASLGRVAAKIEREVHHAENAARGCRLSSNFHRNLRQLSAVTHSLVGVCGSSQVRGSSYDRGRSYGNERRYIERGSPSHRYTDDRLRSRGRSYSITPPRAAICPDDRRSGRLRIQRPIRRTFGFGIGF